ncbi:MAG: O-antigen ligase family protein [Alphaproteobacteria bacterium]|nr:O-antigen ligase family protein [Alphaproteobacteria bacterium]
MIQRIHQHRLATASVIVFLLCPMAFFIPRSAIWLLALGGMVGLLTGSITSSDIKSPISLAILGLILWGGISSIWSLGSLESLALSFRLLLIWGFGIGWCSLLKDYSETEHSKILRWLFLGVITSFVFLGIDYILGNPWQNLWQKSSAKAFIPLGLAISLSAWLCILWLRSAASITLFLGAAFLIFSLIDCDSTSVGLVVGLVVFGLCFLMPKVTVRSAQILAIITILVTPFAVHSFLTVDRIHDINQNMRSYSYVHRLYIWQAIGEKIQNNWMLGYGLDSSRHDQLGGAQKKWPMIDHADQEIIINSREIPIHPHNAPLQWWLELGVIGALLGTLLIVRLLQALLPFRGMALAVPMGLLTTSSVIAFVNLGFWQTWWLAVLWILAGLLMPLLRQPPHKIKN